MYIIISQEMPAERTVIYNRRTTVTGPESYTDDDLDEELYVGRDDRIRDDRDTPSVISHEYVYILLCVTSVRYYTHLPPPLISKFFLQLLSRVSCIASNFDIKGRRGLQEGQ